MTYEGIIERLELIRYTGLPADDLLLQIDQLINAIKQETSCCEPSPFDSATPIDPGKCL